MESVLFILVGKDQGKAFPIQSSKEYTVGRHSENDIEIRDKNVSRNHFRLRITGNQYFIKDLGSKNGTFVGGEDLRPGVETEVKEGDPIVIGMTILGLGDACEYCLKPFLDCAGFTREVDGHGELVKPERIMAAKQNMKFIYTMDRCFMRSKNADEIYRKLLENVFLVFKRIDRCAIITVDERTGRLDHIICRSKRPVKDRKNLFNKELVEQALIMRRPVMVKDSTDVESADERVTQSLQLMRVKSAMCVPISSVCGTRGVIYIDSLSRTKAFRKNDLDLLHDISGRAALALDNVSQFL